MPDALAPLAYDLTLELDPDRPSFRGHVEIRARAAAPVAIAWLHSVDLDITSAAARDGSGALAPLVAAGDGEEMRGYRLPHVLAAGAETTLVFDYTGATAPPDHDEQGLFREQVRGRWYLFAQSESVFARRILPCFDEPRWKPTWRVHLVVPPAQIALGNAPEAARHARPDGAVAIDLAPTPPMPSYLLSVAVGPFDLVDAGAMGRAHVPVRVALPAGEGAHATLVAKRMPAIVDALEAYFDDALPVAKLDLVGVPRFFGGMENPGLITMADDLLVGDPDDPGDPDNLSARRTFQRYAAHELAHLWLGDLVTPAWWDELWLAEAFATWLGDKVIRPLDGFDDAPLRLAEAREHALEADAAPDPRPLRRSVEHGDDAEAAFDAIAYDKGAAVLAMLEHWIGEGELRTAIRAYVRAHAHGTATSADFIHAFATTPFAMSDVLTSYVEHPGVPVVELALRCDVHPARVAATLRDAGAGIAVPLCLRYAGAGGPAETCGVIGPASPSGELALPEAASCPAWVIGNADGAGYYTTQWSHVGLGPLAPLATQSPAERLAYGDDLASAAARGELPVTSALAELNRLAASGDPYADLAALAIAAALDPRSEEAFVARWWDYLAARFASRLAPDAMLAPPTPAAAAARDRLLELLPADALPEATIRRARRELDRALAGGEATARAAPLDVLAAIAGASLGADARGLHARFDELVALAQHTDDDDLRDDLYTAAGKLGRVEIAPALALVATRHGDAAWPALRGFLERPATAIAAWTAVRAQLGAVIASLSAAHAGELVSTLSALCDAHEAAQDAASLAPYLAPIPDGKKLRDHALAVAQHCDTHRPRAGMAAALRR